MEIVETASKNSEMLIELTADVVAAYVSNNPVPAGELPNLIADVHAALGRVGGAPEQPPADKQKPAVNPKKSVHDDYIICLEDGKKFKSLKRHLMTHYGLTPDQYREKWGLRRELSDGRAELRRGAFAACQEDGPRPQAQDAADLPCQLTISKAAPVGAALFELGDGRAEARLAATRAELSAIIAGWAVGASAACGLALDALDHRAQPVGALRRQVLVEAERRAWSPRRRCAGSRWRACRKTAPA